MAELETIYDRLYSYCERRGFSGPDPFDALNSRLFRSTPLKYSRIARLALTQAVKRSAIDLRPMLLIGEGVNPKALALFALAELSRFRAGRDERHADNARTLIARLLGHKIEGTASDGSPTLAFGYNFDWQSRVFYAPRGTPAIVPTAFAQEALMGAFEAFGDEEHLDAANKIAAFVESSLNRPVDQDDEICFSYTPRDRTVVYNASLLAAECLARVGYIANNAHYLDLAERAARFVIRRQRNDGAWYYGAGQGQAWADNFHTAYILISLNRIRTFIQRPETEIGVALDRGMQYWLANFFLSDGTVRYYDRETYPIDIHSAAVAIAGLCELKHLDERATSIARSVVRKTISEMLDPAGYFYYQKRKSGIVKTPFMRWGQAWMAYALARFIESEEHGN